MTVVVGGGGGGMKVVGGAVRCRCRSIVCRSRSYIPTVVIVGTPIKIAVAIVVGNITIVVTTTIVIILNTTSISIIIIMNHLMQGNGGYITSGCSGHVPR